MTKLFRSLRLLFSTIHEYLHFGDKELKRLQELTKQVLPSNRCASCCACVKLVGCHLRYSNGPLVSPFTLFEWSPLCPFTLFEWSPLCLTLFECYPFCLIQLMRPEQQRVLIKAMEDKMQEMDRVVMEEQQRLDHSVQKLVKTAPGLRDRPTSELMASLEATIAKVRLPRAAPPSPHPDPTGKKYVASSFFCQL